MICDGCGCSGTGQPMSEFEGDVLCSGCLLERGYSPDDEEVEEEELDEYFDPSTYYD